MSLDTTSLTSDHYVDKILWEGTIQYTVAGSNNVVNPNFQLSSIPNPTGLKCHAVLSWSVDGVNFYDQQTATYFFFNSFNPRVLSFQAQIGNDASNLYFFMQNGLQTSANVPISQTVTINYVLYALL